MSTGQADQSKPFILSTTFGEYLRGTSNFFLTIALLFSFMEFFDMKVESNSIVFTMILNAVVTNILLEINSKIMFAIVGFLTFISVVFQVLVAFVMLLGTKHWNINMATPATFLITMTCAVIFVAIVLLLELFCSAAMFKLSGAMGTLEPPKKKKTMKKKSKKSGKKTTVESVESARKSSSCSTSCECSDTQTR